MRVFALERTSKVPLILAKNFEQNSFDATRSRHPTCDAGAPLSRVEHQRHAGSSVKTRLLETFAGCPKRSSMRDDRRRSSNGARTEYEIRHHAVRRADGFRETPVSHHVCLDTKMI